MAASESFVSILVAALGTGGIGKFAYDLIRARSGGRKTRAEGDVIIIDAAAKYTQGVLERLDKVEDEFATYRRDQDARFRAQDRLFRAHAQWDLRVQAKLEDLGEEIDAPPPLYTE